MRRLFLAIIFLISSSHIGLADHGAWPRPQNTEALVALCERLGTPPAASQDCVLAQQDAVLDLLSEEDTMHHPDRRLMDRCMHEFDHKVMDYVSLLKCYQAQHQKFNEAR